MFPRQINRLPRILEIRPRNHQLDTARIDCPLNNVMPVLLMCSLAMIDAPVDRICEINANLPQSATLLPNSKIQIKCATRNSHSGFWPYIILQTNKDFRIYHSENEVKKRQQAYINIFQSIARHRDRLAIDGWHG